MSLNNRRYSLPKIDYNFHWRGKYGRDRLMISSTEEKNTFVTSLEIIDVDDGLFV